MAHQKGKFRFTYFTERYQETYQFYHETLGFTLGHSWDRSEHDKGALFEAGEGLIELLHRQDAAHRIVGLDYRTPQGVFMCIQVFDINTRYRSYKKLPISFQQDIVNQSWGHRSFSIVEPNGLVLFFYQEQF